MLSPCLPNSEEAEVLAEKFATELAPEITNEDTLEVIVDKYKKGLKEISHTARELSVKGLRKEKEEIRKKTKPLFSKEFINSLNEGSIEELFQRVLNLVAEKLNVQTFSLFLISKDNNLKVRCRSVYSRNTETLEITNWLMNECHDLGDNFSGKTVVFNEESKEFHCESHCDNDLMTTFGKSEYTNEYKNELKELKCGISVPLNGVHRPIGTIEVINKLNEEGKADEDGNFVETEVSWLEELAEILSKAITRLKIKWEEKVVDNLEKVVDKLASASTSDVLKTSLEEACENLSKNMVNEFMPFKVCIIRLVNRQTRSLDHISSACTSDINLERRDNSPRTKEGEAREKSGVVSEVYSKGESVVVNNIAEDNRTLNNDWYEDNKGNLKSFITMPVKIANEVKGTVSLFTGFFYDFPKISQDFICRVCLNLASIKLIYDLEMEKYEPKIENDEFRFEYIEYNKKLQKKIVYSIDDIFGLIIGYPLVLDFFEYENEDLEKLNKNFLVLILGQWAKDGSKKALYLLKSLIFKDYFNLENITNKETSAIKQAVRQMHSYHRYRNVDKREIIDFIKDTMEKGNRVAKFAACDLACYTIVKDFVECLEKMVDEAKNSNDAELENHAQKNLNILKAKIESGQSAEQIDKFEAKMRQNTSYIA